MSRSHSIHVLSDQTINQIAAGEVVERAASIVKELVENSLDAGALRIEVELRGGGRQLIRVRDDGCGMGAQDSLLCFERHATSKMERIDDLETISTLGFRGEALASIASVAKVELTTCQAEGEGSCVVIEGGKLLSHGPAGCSKGTTLSVRSLFYNAPARRKFQKAPSYEVGEVRKLLATIALAHPAVEFRLTHGEGSLLHLLPASSKTPLEQLRERAGEVLGEERRDEWVPLEWEDQGLSLRGWLSRPSYHRGNRTGHFLYINGRPVTSPLISRAVTEGYGTRLPTHRFPLFLLHLELPGSEVDVNVHPQKREVRFHQEELLGESIYRAVTAALQESVVVRPLPLPVAPMERPPLPAAPRQYEAPPPSAVQREFVLRVDPVAVVGRYALYDGGRLPPSLKERFGSVEGGMVLVDLGRARGRLLFEQMGRPSGASQQMLLMPRTIDLSPIDAGRVASHLEQLNQTGFSIRSLGGTTFLIDAAPIEVVEDLEALLFDSIDHFDQYGAERELARLAARRGALVGSLTTGQASALVEELLRSEQPWEGPCGGATCALLTEGQIEEVFSR